MDYAPGMRFQVLGPLEVEADDGPIALGGPKERLLLALLLTRPNQVVSVEALIRGLWGDQPPATAAKTLQSHVMRVRRALEPGRDRGAVAQVLVTRGPGYLLRVAPDALDAARFEELTTQARRALSDRQAVAAAALLQEALGLWRGQAFEEFLDSELSAAEADRLGELRLVAVEDRIEADLRVGRHRELVAELEGLVRDHPLRERLWAQPGQQELGAFLAELGRSGLVERIELFRLDRTATKAQLASILATFTGDPRRRAEGVLLEAQVAKAGIQLSLLNTANHILFGEWLPQGNFDITDFAWIGGPFALSGNQDTYRCGGGGNYGRFADPTVNALFQQAIGELDPARAAALGNQIDQRLWDQLPSIPLYQLQSFLAWRQDLRSVGNNPTTEGSFWNAGTWAFAKP